MKGYYKATCENRTFSCPVLTREQGVMFTCVCVSAQSLSCVRLFRPRGLWLARFLCLWDFSGKHTGVGCHFLFQGIFSIQILNPRLLYWQMDSLPLSHLGTQHYGLRLGHKHLDFYENHLRSFVKLDSQIEGDLKVLWISHSTLSPISFDSRLLLCNILARWFA